MTKLTDLQSLLLATAASRESGSLIPLPTTIKAPAAGVARSLASLITKALAEEHEVTDATAVHRTDGDLRFGLFITAAGKQAIGVVEDARRAGRGGCACTECGGPRARSAKASPPPILALLQREGGATVPELIADHRLAAAHHASGADRPPEKGPRARQEQARRGDLLPGGRSVTDVEAEITGLDALALDRASRAVGQGDRHGPVPKVSPVAAAAGARLGVAGEGVWRAVARGDAAARPAGAGA